MRFLHTVGDDVVGVAERMSEAVRKQIGKLAFEWKTPKIECTYSVRARYFIVANA